VKTPKEAARVVPSLRVKFERTLANPLREETPSVGRQKVETRVGVVDLLRA
jgi:hypothetical protein